MLKRFFGLLVVFVAILVVFPLPSVAGQPVKRFVPDALLRLADGTSLEVSDFALYTHHYRPDFYTPGSGKDRMEMPVALDGNLWRTIPLQQVRQLVVEPGGDDDHWIRTEVTLTSGQTLRGRIPTDVTLTWIGGDGFEFGGTRSVLGKDGEFTIGMKRVRRFVRDDTNSASYSLTTEDGAIVRLRAPFFAAYWTRPTYSPEKRLDKSDPFGIEVEVENTTVSLKRQDLASIIFTRGQVSQIAVETKKGEKATGLLKTRVIRAYGRTLSGEVWFGDLENVSEVRFLR